MRVSVSVSHFVRGQQQAGGLTEHVTHEEVLDLPLVLCTQDALVGAVFTALCMSTGNATTEVFVNGKRPQLPFITAVPGQSVVVKISVYPEPDPVASSWMDKHMR